MKIRDNYTCPLEIAHDIIKGKWKAIILFQLQYGNTSLSKLQQDIEGINQKMLLQQLKELQEFGLVGKHNFEGYPLHVEYYLTADRGMKMLKAINIMQEIGVDYMVEHGLTDFLDKKGICYK
ncbi:winged helix-turn-helix transcriptional regulator [Clostridium pasteurianum]|uniref:Putative transcriptional regulator n=1 Tax=Clostridium pasteurianum BC1 TaxID=86416 RepID=R4K302_CLOPA|nr:helix-turn-helix domain-containing protein [Clostridium pasteurianum]AGK96101.1 putative transcriptional regulator [Clostridium pasteurianum BC1]